MTDFRALCAELTEHLSLLDEPPHELVCRAQAALAEPETKRPLSTIRNCTMKGMPPNPYQSWQDYFDDCAVTGIIYGLRLKAIQPTPSVNDAIADELDGAPC